MKDVILGSLLIATAIKPVFIVLVIILIVGGF